MTYVYSSKGYYDREAHKTKYRRTLIGKLNEAGEVVPTGKRGRPRKPKAENPDGTPQLDYQSLYESYAKDNRLQRDRIQELEATVENQKQTIKEYADLLRQVAVIGSKFHPEKREGYAQ